ncbi:MAG TPA: hypothetical protein VH583_15990 [Vicinamibacterales bacterium]
MREVAIIGAGELGGAVAHELARRDIARSIVIVDEHGRVAAGKALDIEQSAPVEGFATELRGATDLSYAAAASVVIVADRFRGGEWRGDEGLVLMRRLSQFAASALVVCGGPDGAALVDISTRELKVDRARVIGSAPEALGAAVRAMVALATDSAARDVALTIVGLPPASGIVAWEDATLGGFRLTRVIDEPSRRRIDRAVPALWPPGPLALAAAAVKVVAAIGGRSRQLASCFVAPEPGARAQRRTVALPVRLGPAGIAEVVVPELSAGERVALDNAMLL